MVKSFLLTTAKAILGGAFISLGTYFSRTCPYAALAPLLFSVGIFLVMAFNAELITRHVPTKGFSLTTPLVLVVNLLTAFGLGFLVDLPAPNLAPLQVFLSAILGGIVIGLVSLNNLKDSPYKVVIALLLMYGFVMLGLPHCAVWAFTHADIWSLLLCVAGNLVGGGLLFYGKRLLHHLDDSIEKELLHK